MEQIVISNDPLWYKDAVFYELNIRAFADGNGDGHGDFQGLTARLDYLQDLGVDCIWLLPMYPSPLRDDGYDIADYTAIHPDYGTLADFQAMLDEAHRRGLRVIADLVINHTSDQHPWFQEARASRQSPKRDWYVWSDTDQRYPDARVIFVDSEPSNWAYDPATGQYYWHRFFSHQPDLNFDNPQVQEAILDVMRFWLDKGIDGFRADAVPYLFEREGTSCENLPETHAYLKRMRRLIDEEYPGRILLAEANQWPQDVRAYFGDENEFHMGFHFPAMPRIFMALRQGDRTPVEHILDQTPPIPASCQWCTFLRNHDELTLEMVTEEERQYLWEQYAPDPRMRLNLGIRRRLAPLLDGDRRRIELANSILLTLPGSPTLYYGDEIGMGDDISLPDRNGVRTPMQWTDGPNAGFSTAAPGTLYSPVIADPVYGYRQVNVAAQRADPASLLQTLRRMIRVRQAHPAFGRGAFRLLRPANRAVLAYVRQYEGETIVVAQNLSDRVQDVPLDPAGLPAGRAPVDLLSETAFPALASPLHTLRLEPYQYHWLLCPS
jgi:maltose alpha-D-glucosyltransferase/alpha-amylase